MQIPHITTENIVPPRLGVLYFKQKWTQEIYDKFENPDTEFQVHYWALCLKHKEYKIDFIIPLVVFSYKQTANFASVDYENTDITENSIKTKPLAEKKAKELLILFKKDLENYEKPILVEKCTLHRHP